MGCVNVSRVASVKKKNVCVCVCVCVCVTAGEWRRTRCHVGDPRRKLQPSSQSLVWQQ